ncbi:GNAT family N-acetyltransferase [Streptomyces similanensis]|uniref:GNAT family N-acetyltransferase n=1 Tax=Streptomyces similanensis TaxID=1274988 RepID=A0ABP9K2B6_9ACTN
MENNAVRLAAEATRTAPALVLRPWGPRDVGELVEVFRDDALRRWTSAAVDDEAGAARWVREQLQGWETGERYAFAVVESGSADAGGGLAGHVVLKGVVPGVPSAEVGYWTVAHARGRAVAPRALRALTDWAFTALPAARGAELTRLELVHRVDNTASCRVARKCRYALATPLPPAPPAHPGAGHLHVRERDDAHADRSEHV